MPTQSVPLKTSLTLYGTHQSDRYPCFVSQQPDDNVSLYMLCPSRWTMQVFSVQTLVENYDSLLTFMTEGFPKSLQSFDTIFGFNLLITIFRSSKRNSGHT